MTDEYLHGTTTMTGHWEWNERKKQKEKHEARSCSKEQQHNNNAVSHAVGGHHPPLEFPSPAPERGIETEKMGTPTH